MEIINTIIESITALIDFINYNPGPEDLTLSLFGSRRRKKKGKKKESGRKQRKRELKETTAAAKEASSFLGKEDNFTDQYAGLEANLAGQTQLGATQGYTAGTAGLGTLGAAQGYKAQGYDSQGYTAERAQNTQLGAVGQAQQRNLGAGSDFLSNAFSNLQVGTAAAEFQGAQTDQALASQQAQNAITGGGSATALAQAAAASKQGISANIEQQELQNQKLRAQGQQTLEQGLLSQSNQGNQFGFQQDQFNVGAANQFSLSQGQFNQQTALANQAAGNQASQFGASAQNQASQFGAAAQNQAGQFNAESQNQFAQSRFDATNRNNQFNTQQGNEAAQFGAQASNKANLQQGTLDQESALANQSALNKNQQQVAAGTTQFQETQYGVKSDNLAYTSGLAQVANDNIQQAKNRQTQLAVAGIEAVGSVFSDPRLKEDIERTGTSPSGIPIYEWKYKGRKGRYSGTMSTEVPEYALVVGEYDRVNYSKIDVEFKQI